LQSSEAIAKTVCAAAAPRLATALVGLFFTSGHASPRPIRLLLRLLVVASALFSAARGNAAAQDHPAGQLDIKSIDAPGATTACNRVPFALGSTITDQLTTTGCVRSNGSGYYNVYGFDAIAGHRIRFTYTTITLPDLRMQLQRVNSIPEIVVLFTRSRFSQGTLTLDWVMPVSDDYSFFAMTEASAATGSYTLSIVDLDAAPPPPPPTSITLPAAASLHGAPPTFFHSDVSVFNPSATQSTAVTARYRCFTGACGNAVQTFTVPPRQMRVFDDIVGTLFGAAETGGAVEFSGNVLVDSRLYTPARPAPTVGMYVPGLSAAEAYAQAVLTSLSYSANLATGFRTNVGVYNGNDVAQTVTFTLFSPQGVQLGQTSQFVPARTPVQINNIAAFVGIATDVPSFYCVVRGDGVSKNYAYAAVLDNQSQDLIFVKGAQAQVP
jgi:hypothetical protein